MGQALKCKAVKLIINNDVASLWRLGNIIIIMF